MVSEPRRVSRKQIEAELKRREKDPWHRLKKAFTPLQDRFLRSKAVYRMAHGRNQVGKSTLCVWEIMAYLKCAHPWRKTIDKGKYILLVPGRSQAGKIYGELFFKGSRLVKGKIDDLSDLADIPFITDEKNWKVVWDKTTMPHALRYLEYIPTGCSLTLQWTVTGNIRSREQGTQVDGIFIDEPELKSDAWGEMLLRLSASRNRHGKDLGFVNWYATEAVPNSIYSDFLAKCMSSEYPDWEHFEGSDDESDPMSKETRESFREALGERDYAVRVEGSTGVTGGLQLFPGLVDRDKFFLDAPYKPTSHDNIWVGIDQAWAHPTGIVVAHLNQNDPERIVFTQAWCYSGHDKGLHYGLDLVREYLRGRRLIHGVYDKHNNKGNLDTGRNTLEILTEDFGSNELWNTPEGGRRWLQVAQGQDESYHTITRYITPPSSLYYGPLIQFDYPTAENNMEYLYQQFLDRRGNFDPEFDGPQGFYKKGKGDDAFDAARFIIMARPRWVHVPVNLPTKIFTPKPYCDDVSAPTMDPAEYAKMRSKAVHMQLDWCESHDVIPGMSPQVPSVEHFMMKLMGRS